jgi:hypothetical protein
MISYGGVALHLPSPDEAAWIASQIPIEEAFGFFRPQCFSDDPAFNPRPLFNWFLSRPFKLNAFYNPWGASRWGYCFVLADLKMHDDILAQNASTGNALRFCMDDAVGNVLNTDLFMLPPVPLAKINAIPKLPLYLLPLVDERQRWWEKSAVIDVNEGTEDWSEWTDLYDDLAAALGITLNVDPVAEAYLKPGDGFSKPYQHLPLLLDLCALSVGQRIVRDFDGEIYARNALSAQALMASQVNLYDKYAGGTLDLGVVDG